MVARAAAAKERPSGGGEPCRGERDGQIATVLADALGTSAVLAGIWGDGKSIVGPDAVSAGREPDGTTGPRPRVLTGHQRLEKASRIRSPARPRRAPTAKN